MAAIKKRMLIYKRSLDEWLQDDNLKIVRGIAMQCLTYADLAACLDVTVQTLTNWRKKSPEFAEAVELGRNEADAVILTVSFDQAARGDNNALDRWFRYRMKLEDEKDADDFVRVILERKKKRDGTDA